MLRIDGLKKRFGDIQAVDDLSFSIKKGELFAFLGVNGAGKSTTISIICGQLKSDGGSVKIGGADVTDNAENIKRQLGVVFQNSVLDKSLSAKDNLACRAALYGIKGAELAQKMDEITEILSLGDILKRPVGKLSGGQRRRIDVARALIHSPSILILDEPTTGLDPQTRRMIWDVISRMRREKTMTVMLTTHYMEEAADADHVLIIHKGRKAAEGTPAELKTKYSRDHITLYGKTMQEAAILGQKCEQVSGGVRLEVENSAKATQLILAHPELFTDYEITKGRMDDVFLAVTGVKLGGEAND